MRWLTASGRLWVPSVDRCYHRSDVSDPAAGDAEVAAQLKDDNERPGGVGRRVFDATDDEAERAGQG